MSEAAQERTRRVADGIWYDDPGDGQRKWMTGGMLLAEIAKAAKAAKGGGGEPFLLITDPDTGKRIKMDGGMLLRILAKSVGETRRMARQGDEDLLEAVAGVLAEQAAVLAEQRNEIDQLRNEVTELRNGKQRRKAA